MPNCANYNYNSATSTLVNHPKHATEKESARYCTMLQTVSLLAALLLLVAGLVNTAEPITLSPFDCSKIVINSTHTFDLSEISYPVHTSNIQETPPTQTRTSIDIDLCHPLSVDTNRDARDQCPKGTYICITIETIKDDKVIVTQAIPVGFFTDPSNVSVKAEYDTSSTLKLQLPGATYAGKPQSVQLDWVCDDRAGPTSQPTDRSYDRLEGKLYLKWPTKSVCLSSSDPPPPPPSNNEGKDGNLDSSWGFLHWLFFILTVGFAIYMILGMYNNYNRYGATGWDLVPNKEFWRESPYIAKDAATHVWRSVTGESGRGFSSSGGRGAYEPI